MSKALCTIFGLKELPRPKGDGYFYISYNGKLDGKQLSCFDFYKTSDDELREIFMKSLATLPDRSCLKQYELVNFSAASKEIFNKVALHFSGE